MGMAGEASLPSNAYYPRMPDYTLYSGVHVCWSEHSDSSFVYGFMSLDYGLGTMTATILQTVWTQIRLLLEEQSDQGSHCLPVKIGLKCLLEYSADNINRRHFQMQVFLAVSGLTTDSPWTNAADDKPMILTYYFSGKSFTYSI